MSNSSIGSSKRSSQSTLLLSNEDEYLGEYRPIDDIGLINSEEEDVYLSGFRGSHRSHRSFIFGEDEMKETAGKSNFWWSSFNLVNDVIMSSIVGIPFYIVAMGVWSSAFLLIFFGVVTGQTLRTLHYLSIKYRKRSYPELCEFALGKTGLVMVTFFMFVFNFGGLLTGLQMLATSVPSVMKAFVGYDSPYFSREYTLIFSCLLFLPLTFTDNIAHYRFNSFISVLLAVSMSFILFFDCILNRSQFPMPENALDNQVNFLDFTAAFGGMSFVYVCHDVSFNVVVSMKNPTKRRWTGVVSFSMLLTVFCLTLIGYSGYFMFYQNSQANILDNFSFDDLLANIARIMLSINIVLSVPYTVFMPKVAIFFFCQMLAGQRYKAVVEKWSKWVEFAGALVVIALALLVAELVNNLGATFELVGGVSAAGLAYMLPSLLFLVLEPGRLFSSGKLLNLFVFLLGLFAMFASTGSIIVSVATGQVSLY